MKNLFRDSELIEKGWTDLLKINWFENKKKWIGFDPQNDKASIPTLPICWRRAEIEVQDEGESLQETVRKTILNVRSQLSDTFRNFQTLFKYWQDTFQMLWDTFINKIGHFQTLSDTFRHTLNTDTFRHF